jgi:hypothetical protein
MSPDSIPAPGGGGVVVVVCNGNDDHAFFLN